MCNEVKKKRMDQKKNEDKYNEDNEEERMVAADLDDVGEAGALVRVQRLVHPVGQPRRQYPHLPVVPPDCFVLSFLFVSISIWS